MVTRSLRATCSTALVRSLRGGQPTTYLVAGYWNVYPEQPDPVPHAMVLTGIVVAVSATAFALVLARRIYSVTGSTRLPEDKSR